MAEQGKRTENPVVNGLVALAAVAVVVGVLGGIGVVTATRVLGLNDASNAAADSAEEDGGGGESLYMPEPVETEEPSGPLVTLAPTDDETYEESDDSEESTSEEPSESESADEGRITLSQGAFEVAPGEQLYLSGIYPGGEGAVLDIQYKSDGGAWEDFPVDVNVANETFSTHVETYRSGEVIWRVVDGEKNVKSNEVTVTYTS